MFVTQSLRQQIEEVLKFMEDRVRIMDDVRARGVDITVDLPTCLAVERSFHIAMECATDIGNDLIDALVMRDAGGYADILRVLMEEQVVSRAWFEAFEPAIVLRDKLVHQYRRVSSDDMKKAVMEFASLFHEYAASIRKYLEM